MSATLTEQLYECGHCWRTDVGSPAAGYGGVCRSQIVESCNGEPERIATLVRLCHPNEAGRMDCYRLVTVYGHETPCSNCRSFFPIAGPVDARVTRD